MYFPAGGEVQVDFSGTAGALTAQWINIATGEWGPKQEIAGGGKVKLSPPGKENWAAAITR